MKKMTQHNRLITLTISFMLLASQPVIAEDTEVYLGSNLTPSVVRPNIVFIIDTSGSMSSNVTSTTSSGTYDPNTTYSGSCNTSRVYFSSTGTPPSCSTNQYFDTSANKCNNSSTALNIGGSGIYIGRLARYNVRRNEDRWEGLSTSEHSEKVECQADWGVHGESSATNPYPANANSSGPWRSNTSGAINWNNTGGNYTLYSANYLNWRESAVTTVTKTRLQIVKEVFSSLMDSISNVNIAVMRYDNKSASYNKGGYFVMPMQQLTDANRADYKTAVNNFTANGYTPLAETMHEAYLYYRGDTVKFGNSTTPGTNVAGVLDPADSSKYQSPIDYQCQKNFVILLTDGEPTYDTDADTAIKALTGFSAVTGSSTCSGDCLDELTQYMNAKDCSTSHSDTQNVVSYVIGFTLNLPLLNDAATKGGGKYYTADDTTGLTDAFTSIMTEIQSINTTFIAPAVSVNAFNRFNHRDELYYAVFRPKATPSWDGNIKRFKLDGDPPIIVDKNGVAAIDSNTGFFKTSATSFWTDTTDAPDGDEVKEGGAASRLALPRTVYTYTGATAANNELLTSASNQLHEDNAAVTVTMLGDTAMTTTDRTELLQWARGIDLFDVDSDGLTTDIRRRMGDPLHTKPVLVSYSGTDAAPDMTLYSGTNEGYLQAINTTTGAEVFTFAPQELLPNLKTLYEDASSVAHPYGLDGPLTMWFNDANGNGILFNNTTHLLESGEHVYLYQGMRRGGKNYYALDVTDRTAPRLKWVIKGGSGDFSELAQSWSAATKATVKINGVVKNVLIFGGGYDVDQDSNTTAQNDDSGRAIFMVDASTGAKLWQAGPAGSANGGNPNLLLTAMTNSIPADITVIDTDGDGYTDRMYAADTRAQVWRFDINNTNTGASTLVTGGVIARLGDSTAEGNRRFYYAPDVSLSMDMTHLNIAIGSGYREHPLNTTIRDAFFVIRDENIYTPAVNVSGIPVYTTLTMSDLYDTTSNVISQGTAAEVTTAQAALASKEGWYIWMEESDGSFVGEKVLAKSLTFANMVMFTTYTPIASAVGACSPSQGRAIAYLVNIDDGTPVYDFDSSGGSLLTQIDRRMDLVRGGIPPEPSLLFHENGPVVLVGTEKAPDPGILLSPTKTYWRTE
jgi:type IV pilus assembly protein PilY1